LAPAKAVAAIAIIIKRVEIFLMILGLMN